MRALLPVLLWLPTLFLIYLGWFCMRAARRVIRAEGPDVQMLVPFRRGGLAGRIGRALHDDEPTMSARGVRRLGLMMILLSPLPLGFTVGWHVFNPAYWMRQGSSPCVEIVPLKLVAKYAKGEVDVDVKDEGERCWARFEVGDRTVLRVAIRPHGFGSPFKGARTRAKVAGDVVDTVPGFERHSLVRRGDKRTTIMILRRGYLLEAEAQGRLHGERPEGAITRAIRKSKRRIQLDKR